MPIFGQPLSVTNLAALASVDTQNMESGSTAYVQTLRDVFVFEQGVSVAAPSVMAIDTPYGQWHRRLDYSLHWRGISTWLIDGTNGNDENRGDSTAPIRTFDELFRRLGTEPIVSPTIVQVAVGNYALGANTINGNVRVGVGGFFGFVGNREVLVTETLTSFVEANWQTKEKWTVGANSVNWATFVGKRIDFDGGYVAWITADLGGGMARISTPTTIWDGTTLPDAADYAVPQPGALGIGSKFEVVDLPTIGDVILDVQIPSEYTTGVSTYFAMANVQQPEWNTLNSFRTNTSQFFGVKFYGCNLQTTWLSQSVASIINCSLVAFSATPGANLLVVAGCCREFFEILPGAVVYLVSGFYSYNSQIWVHGGRATFYEKADSVYGSVIIEGGNNGVVVQLGGSLKLHYGKVWGETTSGHGFIVQQGSFVTYNQLSAIPNVNGPAGEVLFITTEKNWTDLPYTETVVGIASMILAPGEF